MPNPPEGNPPPFLEGRGRMTPSACNVTPDPARHVVAHVFKVSIDPFVGKLGMFRVHQGTVRPGSAAVRRRRAQAVQGRASVQAHGQGDTRRCPQAIPGDICAVAKVDELHFDAVLHDSHDEDHYHLKSIDFPPPMPGLAIEPERRGEEQRLSDALHKLVAEDPCVRIEHHAALNETVLYGMGELHLRVLLERMTERYGVQHQDASAEHSVSRDHHAAGRRALPPQEADRRRGTVRRGVPARRGAGARQGLRVRRRGRGRRDSRPVHSRGREGRAPGADRRRDRGLSAAGHPRHRLRRQASRGGFEGSRVRLRRAARRSWTRSSKASPIVLEPVVRVEITAPATSIGDITGDLATKRARINGNDALPNQRARSPRSCRWRRSPSTSRA